MNAIRPTRLLAVLWVSLCLSSAALAAEPEHLAEAGGHGEAGASTPLSFSGDLALWSGIVFLLFLGVLWKLAWKPMTSALDQREQLIRNDITAAEQARVKAERMLADHAAKLDRVQEEVKEILAEARRDAETARQNILSDANAEAEATKNRAIAEIERVKDQALKELFDHMANRVADATEQVLGRGLTVADQDRLIEDSLSRFHTMTPANRV